MSAARQAKNCCTRAVESLSELGTKCIHCWRSSIRIWAHAGIHLNQENLILLNIVAAFWKSNRLLSLHTSQLAHNAGAFHSFSRVLGSRVLGIKMLPNIVKWLSSCFCLQTKSYMKLTSISFSVKISEKMLGFNNNYYNYHNNYYTYREINTLTRFSRLTFFWGILLSLCTAV